MRNEEKMVITDTLVNTLLDCLVCVAISANGGYVEDSDLSPVEEYARAEFNRIMERWANFMGKEWVVKESEDREN